MIVTQDYYDNAWPQLGEPKETQMAAKKTVKLHMQKGTDEVNYGNQSFPVGRDGNVEVPIEAEDSLLHEGGATEVKDEDGPEEAESPDSFAKVRHVSDPNASFTHDGITYEADKDGNLRVPHACVALLTESHGFVVC